MIDGKLCHRKRGEKKEILKGTRREEKQMERDEWKAQWNGVEKGGIE